MALKFGAGMKAWVLEAAGKVGDLAVKEVEVPQPGPGQLRVRVAAACVNPVDFKHAGFAGMAAFPAVFGCDGAGFVDEVGAGVAGFAKGERVHFFGNVFAEFGSFAAYCLVDAGVAVKVPEGMDLGTAAATPCAAWTAYEALYDRLRIEQGKTIYVAAGAGGVGHLAIQMAKASGLRVITSASGDNVARLRSQGYEVVDYKAVPSVKDEVLKLTDGKGVHYAFEMLGESQALEALGMLRRKGALAHIAMPAPSLPNAGNFVNALTTHHVFIPGNVADPECHEAWRATGAACNALLCKGTIAVDISKTVGFDGVRDALLEQESGHVRGKILISMAEPADAVRKPDFKF